MTQRKAVVPIKETFVHHGTEIATLGVGGGLMVDNFKLTKADVENIVVKYLDEFCLNGKTQQDSMIAALKAIGIEVEE